MKNSDSPPSSTPTSARQCAVQLLDEVLARNKTLDIALAHHPQFSSLSERDRNFTRLLVMTCLRRLGQIDAILSECLKEPLKGRTQDVQHCLRLGVTQLLWLETPAHAAVNESVETAAALGHATMKGLVNAVLKRVAKDGKAMLDAQNEARLNTPEWLYKSWENLFGRETARAISSARLNEAPLDITVKSDAEKWAKTLEAALLPNGSLRLQKAGRVDILAGFDEGAWWVQDAAATLPVQMLGDIRGKTVLDLCAAPGGKTAQLAAAGAKVIAVDQNAKRLEILESNLKRLHLEAEIMVADVLKWKPKEPVDAILLDAPCSATGTLRRHPELVWQRSAEDITRLTEIQRRLLQRTINWLKPGGRLVYCVCSMQAEEGEKQVEAFLAKNPGFKREHAKNIPSELLSSKGELLTHPALWPEHGGLDGFYAALLVKSA